MRRQLGHRLRRLREAAGKTIEDVIAAGVASRSKVWRLEAGKSVVKQGDVLALARLYGLDSTVTDELVTLAAATKDTAGFLENTGVVPQSLGLYADLESAAAVLQLYSSELVHGLLQTADYARGVIQVDPELVADVVEQRVEFRMRRQREFFAVPRDLEVVMTAGALGLVVSSSTVMESQIAHLRAVARGGTARIGVLSAANGLHSAMRGPFSILAFQDYDDPPCVYTETLVGGRYMERQREVEVYQRSFVELSAKAVPIEEYEP